MWIDIVLLAFIVFGFYQGFRRGLVFTVFRVLALLLGVLLAIKYTPAAGNYLKSAWALNPRTGVILGFLGILTVVYVGVFLVGKLVDLLVKVVQLGLANRVAGALVSLVVYLFLFSAFIKIIDNLGFLKDEIRQQSKAYPVFVSVAPVATSAMGIVVPQMKNIFDDIKQQVDSL